MKICIINNLFKLYVGKQMLYADMIAGELAREHEVVVITAGSFSGAGLLKPSVEDSDGIRVYRYYPLNLYNHYPYKYRPVLIRMMWHLIEIWNPHSYFVVRNILKKEKPDIVHTMNLLGMSPPAVFAAIKAAGCRHVHTTTDGALISPWANLLRNGEMISFNWLDRLYLMIKRGLTPSPDKVASLSRFMLETHRRHGYFNDCPACVIEYPYRLSPKSSRPKTYSPFHILFVGNIVGDKGIYTILDAFENLRRDDVHLHFAGSGPELENLRSRAGGIPNVHVHGFVNDENLRELYSLANMTVVPSLCFEAGKAAAFLESLPFGTPVIASTAGGGHEGVIDGVNGRLFEPGDSRMLKDILQELLENPEKLKDMEREAKRSADDYRLDKCVRELINIYDGVRHDYQN